MKLLNLAWDLLGSDFAGRHMQYEKFYAGPGFVMNSYSYGTGPWEEWAGLVDDLLASTTRRTPCQKNNQSIRDEMTPKRGGARGLVRVLALCHAFAIAAGAQGNAEARPQPYWGDAFARVGEIQKCAITRNMLLCDDGRRSRPE